MGTQKTENPWGGVCGGWDVWHIYSWHFMAHTWSYAPLGCVWSIALRYLMFDVVAKIHNQKGIGVGRWGVMVQLIYSYIDGHLGHFHWLLPIQFISIMSEFCIICFVVNEKGVKTRGLGWGENQKDVSLIYKEPLQLIKKKRSQRKDDNHSKCVWSI